MTRSQQRHTCMKADSYFGVCPQCTDEAAAAPDPAQTEWMRQAVLRVRDMLEAYYGPLEEDLSNLPEMPCTGLGTTLLDAALNTEAFRLEQWLWRSALFNTPRR